MHIESSKAFCFAISDNVLEKWRNVMNIAPFQPPKPQVQRSQCSIQHGRNHTANNIYKCWTSCNKCKYLFLQYSVPNQKHNSYKIYFKILQVVSKERKYIKGHRQTGSSDIILKGGHTRTTIPPKFGPNWPS